MPRVPHHASTIHRMLWVMVFAVVVASRALGDPIAGDQTTSSDTSLARDRVPHGGLQFLIGSNFTLASFDGALLSYRTQGSNGRGWRFGADLGGSVRNLDNRIENPDTAYTRTQKQRAFSVNVVGQRLFSTAARHDLNFYWGDGSGSRLLDLSHHRSGTGVS